MTTQQSEGFVPVWTLGDRLRKARATTGLTVAKFSEKIGVSPKTINNAEGDKVEVRRITLNAWALATGVSVEWLETGEGSDGSTPPGGQRGLDKQGVAELAASKRSRTRGRSTDEYPFSALAA